MNADPWPEPKATPNQKITGTFTFDNGWSYFSHSQFDTYAEARQWVKRMLEIYPRIHFPWY